jgi:hypothetical protein
MIEFIHCSSHEILFEIAQCWKDIELFKIIFEIFKFVIIGLKYEQFELVVKVIIVEMLRTGYAFSILTKAFFRENRTYKVGPQPF